MPFNVPLKGKIEPAAATWGKATAADRRAFYKAAASVAVAEHRRQLLRGVGADGQRLIPRQRPRRDGANGPPLSPHRTASRTVRLLAARATPSSVTLYWHAGMRKGQRLPWGNILEAHASGTVIGAYLRDVRPSPRTVAAIADRMATWWTARQRNKARRRKPPAPQAPPERQTWGQAARGWAAKAWQAVKSVFKRGPQP